MVQCINKNDESDYRQEMEQLGGLCRDINLCVSVKETKDMIVLTPLSPQAEGNQSVLVRLVNFAEYLGGKGLLDVIVVFSFYFH